MYILPKIVKVINFVTCILPKMVKMINFSVFYHNMGGESYIWFKTVLACKVKSYTFL